MNLHLLKTWDRVRSSFWFIPTLMAAGAVMLVYLTIYVDERATGG